MARNKRMKDGNSKQAGRLSSVKLDWEREGQRCLEAGRGGAARIHQCEPNGPPQDAHTLTLRPGRAVPAARAEDSDFKMGVIQVSECVREQDGIATARRPACLV
jgi:hypothetical protein